jgi:hypothetical protein
MSVSTAVAGLNAVFVALFVALLRVDSRIQPAAEFERAVRP